MAGNQQKYEDFEPKVDLKQEDGCTIIDMHLPGFSKERLRVQVSSTGKLRISGERLYRNNKQQRFQKEFQIPSNCEANKITAKYKGGILQIRQPLRDQGTTKEKEKENEKQETETETKQKQKQQQEEEALEKKTTVSGEGKANETSELVDAKNSNKITSIAAGRFKDLIFSNSVKLVLAILVAMSLLFLYAKRRQSPTMFVEEHPPY